MDNRIFRQLTSGVRFDKRKAADAAVAQPAPPVAVALDEARAPEPETGDVMEVQSRGPADNESVHRQRICAYRAVEIWMICCLQADNALRKRHRIKVKGSDVPSPLRTFSQLQEVSGQCSFTRLSASLPPCNIACCHVLVMCHVPADSLACCRKAVRPGCWTRWRASAARCRRPSSGRPSLSCWLAESFWRSRPQVHLNVNMMQAKFAGRLSSSGNWLANSGVRSARRMAAEYFWTIAAGSGKTLAYLLPIVVALCRRRARHSGKARQGVGPRAAVLSPTRELAAQV